MNPTAGATATAAVQNPDPNNMAQIPYTFSATDNFSCTYDTTVAVHVLASRDPSCCIEPTPQVNAGNIRPCSNSTTLMVTNGFSGPDNTGEWTYTSNTGGIANFTNPTSLNTSVSVNIYGEYTFTWHEYYHGNHSCTGEASVTVNFARQMDATLADISSCCRSAAMITLSAPDFGTLSCTYTNAQGSTQNYTGPAFNTEARTFNPSAATPGQYTITNTISTTPATQHCISPATSSKTFSIYDEIAVDLAEPECTSGANPTVTLTFNIQGVANPNLPPAYTIESSYIEYADAQNGNTPTPGGDTLHGRTQQTYTVTAHSALDYNFLFTSENGCGSARIPGYFACACPNYAGVFADYSGQVRCTGESITLNHSDETLDELGGVFSYVVCTNPSDILHSIVPSPNLQQNSATISLSDITGGLYNTQYYVVAVAGYASGAAAWTAGGCYSVSRPLPVMWKETPHAVATTADTCGRVITLRGNAPGDGMRGYWTAEAGYTTIAGTDNTMNNATVLSDVDGIVNYTWHLVNAECTGESSPTPYNFRKIPTPQAGRDTTVCGLSALINGAQKTQPPIDNSTIMWTTSGGVVLTPPDSEQPVANANSEGTYTITLTERNGSCAGSDNVNITYISVPAPYTTNDVDTICGQVVELEVLNFNPDNEGRWTAYRMDGSVLPVASYQAYNNPTLPSSDRYPHCFATVMIPDNVSEIEYEFRWAEPISDPRLPAGAECIGVASRHVVFRKMPSVSVHVCGSTGDQIAVCGRTVELCADTIASAGYATYSWMNKDNINGTFDNPNSSETTFTVDSAIHISTYLDVPFYFVARNRSCMVIDTMNVRFLERPEVKAGPDHVACGRDYTLSGAWGLEPSDSYTPTCQWTNLTRPAGAHAPTWPNGYNNISSTVHVNGYGIYTFEIRETNTAGNASSCYNTDTVTVEFMEQPVVNAGPDFDVCGLDFTMNAVGSHIEGDSISGSWICQSGGNAAFVDREDPHTAGHFSSYGTATFWWIETNHPHIETLDPETCTSYDEVQITFYEIPSASINMNAADTITCGLSYFLRADASGSDIQGYWYEVNPSTQFGAYNSTYTDVTVSSYGRHEFYWIEYNGPTDNQYFCKDTSEAWTVEFVRTPVAQIQDTVRRFCSYEGRLHVDFDGVGEGIWSSSVASNIITFDDSNDPNTTIHTTILNSDNQAYPYFTLYWHVQNTDFCSDEDSIRVIFARVPSDSIVVIPPKCFGEAAVLTAFEDSLRTYDWQYGNGIIDSVATNPQTGEFQSFVRWDDKQESHVIGLTTTNSWGCQSNVGRAVVYEPALPEYHYNIIQDTCSLGKGGIEFLDTTGAFAFFWIDSSENSANAVGPDPATGAITEFHVYNIPTGDYVYRSEYQTYNLTYMTSYQQYFGTSQCIDYPIVEVGTIGMIEAEFAVSADIILEDLVAPDAQVMFVNSTNYDNVGKKCEWHFGDGVVEKNCDELVEHVYAEPGCYDPYLIVMNRDLPECRDTAFLDKCIFVDKESKLEIPNIFSPNDDGVNDYFQVHAQTLKSFNGKIINRYGRLVYEWTDWETMEAGWDGRLNGSTKATPGVYYVIIDAVGYDGNEYHEQKALHLVR